MIDADWFKDQIAAKRLSQRQFAALLEMDPSSFSLMLQGKRKMTLARAVDIARILGLRLDDVCSRAGVGIADGTGRVPIIGYISGGGEVAPARAPFGMTIHPDNLPADSVAYVMRTTQTELEMMNGWVVFAGPEESDAAAALDRTAIVQVNGREGALMRQVRRGATTALFTLTGIAQMPMHDVIIDAMRIVLLLRPL